MGKRSLYPRFRPGSDAASAASGAEPFVAEPLVAEPLVAEPLVAGGVSVPWAGSQMANAEPRPTSETTFTSPPWALATWRTIVRPRPLRFSPRVPVASPRQ